MTRVSVPERGMETLFGTHDENLRFLEDTFKVRIKSQGNELLIEGDEQGPSWPGRSSSSSRELMKDGYAVASADVRLAAQLLARDGEAQPARLPAQVRDPRRQEDGRAAQPQPASLPRGRSQKNDMVFGIGPAGTGKTYLAVAQAVSLPDDQAGRTASSWPVRRSRRARSSASCPATCSRRSIPTCGRSTTRSTT